MGARFQKLSLAIEGGLIIAVIAALALTITTTRASAASLNGAATTTIRVRTEDETESEGARRRDRVELAEVLHRDAAAARKTALAKVIVASVAKTAAWGAWEAA